ncbi:MAG: sigma 54-interacting transcriptional regulator [Erysipelotrichaceae bacterium]
MKTKTSKKDLIYNYVHATTEMLIKNNHLDLSGSDALGIAIDLRMDRANVSKELNLLWKEGKLIKIQSKPVLYLDYDELMKNFQCDFIPSIVAKGELLTQYLHPKQDNISNSDGNEDDLDTIIGAHGSLSESILKAKSAVSYPPYGLHTIISGNHGVGKTKFATGMYKYAIQSKAKDKDITFTTIHCRTYSKNSELFAQLLLGVSRDIKKDQKLKRGLLESNQGGIIFLDEIQYLSISSKELIISIINQNSYSRFGETLQQKLKVMFIASIVESTEENDDAKKIYQYMPVHIHLTDIDKHGYYEKLELVLDLFSKEANEIKKPIKVHKDIIVCFINMKYEENITQLKNEIRLACSKAYLNCLKNATHTIHIGFHDLSQEMLAYNNNGSQTKVRIINLISSYKNEYFMFSADGSSDAIKHFKEAPKKFSVLRINQFINEFNVDIESLDNIEDYARENILCLKTCGEAQLNALKSNIHPFVFQSVMSILLKHPEFQSIQNNVHLLYGILLHITNLLKRIELSNNMESPSFVPSVTENIYNNEYKISKEIFYSFKDLYQIKYSNKEIDFLASYLAIINQYINQINVPILVICHGNTTATDMVNYVRNAIPGNYELEAIDFKNNMQLNDLLELACIKAVNFKQGSSLLIMCDMQPLTSISEYILKETGINSRSIYPVNLPWLLQIVEKSLHSATDIDSLLINTSNHDITPIKTEATKDNFIINITNKIIRNMTAFIDCNKAVDILLECLNKTLLTLNITYSDEVAVKYLCHCICMLERVIKNEPWDYMKLNTFINKNHNLMNIVEQNLSLANELYQIKIPSSELAYITEIFMQ